MKNYWDLKFVKNDKYKIAIFCFPKTGSTSILHTINSLNASSSLWNKDMTNITTTAPEGYRTFFFVRNPYSRVFSWYKNFSYPEHLIHNIYLSLDDYLSYIARHKIRIDSFQSAIRKLPDDAEIYRFEEFDFAMREILDSVGLTDHPVSHINPTIALSRGVDYKKIYTDKTKFMIRCMHNWELKNLNYTFDSYGELPTVRELKNKLRSADM